MLYLNISLATKMLPVSYIFFFIFLTVSVNAQKCDLPEPRYSIVQAFLKGSSKTWYAQQQHGVAPIISTKCYSMGLYLQDLSLFNNAIDVPFTYYDLGGMKQSVRIRNYIIGNQAKYYLIANNKETTFTVIAISDRWLVLYGCQEGRGAVIIMTAQKRRDEQVIGEATREAQKIVQLPQYWRNLECNKVEL